MAAGSSIVAMSCIRPENLSLSEGEGAVSIPSPPEGERVRVRVRPARRVTHWPGPLSPAPAPPPSPRPPAAGLICRGPDRHCPIRHIEWRTASTICASTARRGHSPSGDKRRTLWPTR
jgi:hypothetical protein